MGKKTNVLSEFFEFLKESKAWWLTPIILMFLILAALILLTERSAVVPFIYALF